VLDTTRDKDKPILIAYLSFLISASDNDAVKLTTVVITAFPEHELTNITDLKAVTTTIPVHTDININSNKSVVKRDVDGSIFWNGIYDDYGGRSEPEDEAIGNKEYSRGLDFVKRSGYWMQDKMRNLTNIMKKKSDSHKGKTTKKRLSRGLNNLRYVIDHIGYCFFLKLPIL
jgi:hypothetical protein